MRPSPLYNAIGAFSAPILYGLYRLRVKGLENVPEEGGYVLACNHVSNFDPWAIGLPLWPKRFLRFMAKSELYWWPLTFLLNGAVSGAAGTEGRCGDRHRRSSRAGRQRRGDVP